MPTRVAPQRGTGRYSQVDDFLLQRNNGRPRRRETFQELIDAEFRNEDSNASWTLCTRSGTPFNKRSGCTGSSAPINPRSGRSVSRTPRYGRTRSRTPFHTECPGCSTPSNPRSGRSGSQTPRYGRTRSQTPFRAKPDCAECSTPSNPRSGRSGSQTPRYGRTRSQTPFRAKPDCAECSTPSNPRSGRTMSRTSSQNSFRRYPLQEDSLRQQNKKDSKQNLHPGTHQSLTVALPKAEDTSRLKQKRVQSVCRPVKLNPRMPVRARSESCRSRKQHKRTRSVSRSVKLNPRSPVRTRSSSYRTSDQKKGNELDTVSISQSVKLNRRSPVGTRSQSIALSRKNLNGRSPQMKSLGNSTRPKKLAVLCLKDLKEVPEFLDYASRPKPFSDPNKLKVLEQALGCANNDSFPPESNEDHRIKLLASAFRAFKFLPAPAVLQQQRKDRDTLDKMEGREVVGREMYYGTTLW